MKRLMILILTLCPTWIGAIRKSEDKGEVG